MCCIWGCVPGPFRGERKGTRRRGCRLSCDGDYDHDHRSPFDAILPHLQELRPSSPTRLDIRPLGRRRPRWGRRGRYDRERTSRELFKSVQRLYPCVLTFAHRSSESSSLGLSLPNIEGTHLEHQYLPVPTENRHRLCQNHNLPNLPRQRPTCPTRDCCLAPPTHRLDSPTRLSRCALSNGDRKPPGIYSPSRA